MTAALDIFTNVNNTVCPDACFRPVGIAFDSQKRLYVSSDATGEIYVVMRDEAANSSATASATGTASGSNPSTTNSSALSVFAGRSSVSVALASLLATLLSW